MDGRLRLREVRLATGLVLLAFMTTHFLNHALGLVSVPAMEAGRAWFNLLWRSPPGTVLLYGSLLVHFAMALLAIYRRHTLRMPAREAAQIGLGLVLPFLLVSHVTGTRIEYAVTGREVSYHDVVWGMWVLAPENAARQVAALLIGWTHACLGVFFWLRGKPWFGRVAQPLYTVGVLVPVLALLGFAQAGKDLLASPGALALTSAARVPGREVLGDIRMALFLAFAGLIAAAFAARAARDVAARRHRVVVAYPAGKSVAIPRGFSVLEASRLAGLPHMSACGGRGRCTTCRVLVTSGAQGLPEPGAQERATLNRIKAGPNVRLACQLRPTQHLSVVPVLTAQEPRAARPMTHRAGRGREREIAVLFCDLRGFTKLTEKRLPFDTVFLLNRYFEAVGHAVEEAGGHLDKFVGDGALAIFGLQAPPDKAARQAVAAAFRILEGVGRLNETYASELDHPLQVAMSLHAGPAIVGEMGYGQATSLTAVGDTINAASRLENLAKDEDAELVVSDALAAQAGLDLAGYERRTLSVRGRAATLDAWVIPSACGLIAAAAPRPDL